MSPSPIKSILGHGGKWTQNRRDCNNLFGSDTSGGTNAFSSPSNANDGNNATAATRAKDDGPSTDLNHAYGTVVSDPNKSFNATVVSNPTNANDASDSTEALAAGWAASPNEFCGLETDLGAAYTVTFVRIRNGTFPEGPWDLNTGRDAWWYSNDGSTWSGGVMGTAIAGSWSLTASYDGVFTPTTPITARYHRYDRIYQTGAPSGLGCYSWELHGGSGYVGDVNDYLEADLGAAYAANRMELLEDANTGKTYGLSYSTDHSTWHTITATRTYLGSNRQRYDFDEIVARWWRITDDYPSGGSIPARNWYTWTIEGFPF